MDDYARKIHDELAKVEYTHIIGSDEVGYGSWAGPLVVCAVLAHKDWKPPKGVNDSKKVRPAKRDELFEVLRYKVTHAVEMAESSEIDEHGIMAMLYRCHRNAIEKVRLKEPKAIIVVDGEVKIPGLEHYQFPKADGIVPVVSAASIIAKVTHDRIMWDLAKQYPGYGLSKSMGYGTSAHRDAIAKLGLTPIHRRSYIPLLDGAVEDGIIVD